MCTRGKLDVKGTKDLHFFLRGGTKYGERRQWLACTCEARKGGCNGAAGMPQKGDDGDWVACACTRGGGGGGGVAADTVLLLRCH